MDIVPVVAGSSPPDSTPTPITVDDSVAKFFGLDAGKHNQDLENARLRVMKGGSWKRQDVVVVLPASVTVPTKCVISWMNLIYPPNNGVVRMAMVGQEVGEAYCNAINTVLANEHLAKFKYILTIEHDNVPPSDGVLKLAKTLEEHPELAAISGLYWTKGIGGVPQIWGDIHDPIPNYRPQPPQDTGIIECYGIGMGFALWRLDMFKDDRLRKPWFKTAASAAEGVGTQDLWFWSDARKYGYRCAVDCDVKVGHYDHVRDENW